MGRRRRHRLRDDLRPQGLRLLAGLHRLRRHALRGLRREDLQGHGPRPQARLPADRDQRLGRRAHPGGRRLARRLRGDLLAQRPGLGRDPADQPDHGAERGRRRLLARDDRLRAHGQGDLVHVHHRARGREDRHRRGGHLRGARRRAHARLQVGRGPLRRRRRGELPRGRALPPLLPAAEQRRPAALLRAGRPAGPRGPRARHAHPGRADQALRHAGRHRPRGRRRRVPRGAPALGREHRLSASRASAGTRSASSATTRGRSRARSTSTRR